MKQQKLGNAMVGWVVFFDLTDPNANTFYGVTTLSIGDQEIVLRPC